MMMIIKEYHTVLDIRLIKLMDDTLRLINIDKILVEYNKAFVNDLTIYLFNDESQYNLFVERLNIMM